MNSSALLAVAGGSTFVFWICGGLAVIGAIGMIVSSRAVHSALFVGMSMINLAIIYVSLQAPFLGMIQVIVYTGAVMMLFLFVVMLVGIDSSDSLIETIRGQRWISIIFCLGFGALLIGLIGNGLAAKEGGSVVIADLQHGGNVTGIASLLFTRYYLAFEVTSALLISAALGAMVLAHRERYSRKPTQEDLSIARFRSGEHPGNLPASGSYARHNAVDMPALLPDGTPAEISIPRPLLARGQVRAVSESDEAEVVAIAAGEPIGVAESDGGGEPR